MTGTSTTDDVSKYNFMEFVAFNNRLNILVAAGIVPYHAYVRFDMQDFCFNPDDPKQIPKYERFKAKLDDLRHMRFDSPEDMDSLQEELSKELLEAKSKRRNQELN